MPSGKPGGESSAFVVPDSRCSFCGQPLTPHEVVTGGVCSDKSCRRELAVRHAVEARARRKRGQLARARVWFARLRRDDRPRYPGDALVAVLPINRQPLVPLKDDRREAIRAQLTAALSEAKARAADLEPGEWTPPGPRFTYEIRESDLPILGFACAVCRGHCCAAGGDNAFLSSDVFIPRLLADPDLTTDDLLDECLGRLPAAGFRDHCVFQGEPGCALPREMRSSTCNSFLCNSLLELGKNYTAHGPRPVFVVAMDGESICGGAMIRDDRLEFRVDPNPETTTFR